ncbi:hypothetical protein, partial [Uruburuella suis]|uniref:hypothetical protein n=1 Tax=Uruburuella suis TaxID=252130 RepID=UPI001A9EFDFF
SNPTLVRRTRHAHRFGRWPNVGFKNPTYADDVAELLLFCKVIFLELVLAYFFELVLLNSKRYKKVMIKYFILKGIYYFQNFVR